MSTQTLDAVGQTPTGSSLKTSSRFSKFRSSPFSVVSIILAVLLAALGIYPLLVLVFRMVLDSGAPITAIFDQPDLGQVILNTLIIVGVSTPIALVIGAVLAWINERTDARMGIMTDAMPMIPFMLPPIAGAIGWILLMAPNAGYINGFLRWIGSLFGVNLESGPLDIYSWYGLILVYIIYAVPYAFMMCSAGLRNFDPALEEQSRVSGASLTKTLFTVTIPGMTPSLLGATMLMLWSGFGLFSIPAVIGKSAGIEVLSVRIVSLLTVSYPPEISAAIGLCLIVIGFVAIAWWLQSRVLAKGRFSTIGGKGARVNRIRLGKGRPFVRIAVLGYIGVTTVLPLYALVMVSLSGFWTLNIKWDKLNLDSFIKAAFQDEGSRTSLQHSLLLGVVGATLGIVMAAIVSLYTVRTRTPLARILDGSIKFPSTLSHIVLAVGFILAFSGPPFNLGGTLLILLMAYIALYLPQAAVSSDTAVGQVAPELAEASRVAGASEGRTFAKIYAPLMIPGLIVGWALLFVRMIGDLTASALLAGTNNNVVGFRILEIYTNGSYALLAALSTILTFISAFVVIIVLIFSRRNERRGRSASQGGPVV